MAKSFELSQQTNSPTAGFRNMIINGDFGICQRGTSLSASSAFRYMADRWLTWGSGSTNAPSRQSVPPGETYGGDNMSYYHRNVVGSSAGSANYAIMTQKIEGARTFAGNTVTISYWARADVSRPIAIELEQNFGTGGSPTSPTLTFVAKPTLTTTMEKYTHTITLPSVGGKTFGTTTGTDFLGLNIWFDSGSTYNGRTGTLGQQSGTFDFMQVQLEQGRVATPFEQRSVGTELALCQRYYFKTFPMATAPAQNAGSPGAYMFAQLNTGATNCAYPSIPFPVRMRSIPTITTYNPSAANTQARNNITSTDYSVTTNSFATEWSFGITATGPAGGGVGQLSYLHYTADAEL